MAGRLHEHRRQANELRQRVLRGPGETASTLREAVAARVSAGPNLDPPFDALAEQIGVAAYRVTDGQVAEVREALGSDKAAFEVVAAAAVAAGLLRWDIASKVLEEASNAP